MTAENERAYSIAHPIYDALELRREIYGWIPDEILAKALAVAIVGYKYKLDMRIEDAPNVLKEAQAWASKITEHMHDLKPDRDIGRAVGLVHRVALRPKRQR